jgi:DNA-binding CsgD family transcriptional regulator/tetratricopeptide (TPR) repeat protein
MVSDMVSDDGSVAPAPPDDLVGREGELELLGHRLTLARQGAPQVVLVEAGPGAGKSALLEAYAAEQVTRARDHVAWLRCDPLEQSVELAACEVLLGGGSTDGMSEQQVGRRLLSWLRDLQSSGATALLAIDDAQWMDRSSARALRFALRRLRGDRVLTVIARRPTAMPSIEAWTDDPAATTWVRPAPLTNDQIRDLARHQRSWELSSDTVERLAARSSGLPLFVSALVRSADSPTELAYPESLPTSVTTAALGLLRAVPNSARLLVESSAVLDEAAPLVVLGQVARIPEVSEAAEQARTAGLLRVVGTRLLGCAHPLLQESVYAAMPLGRRRELHARAAECTTGERRLTHRALATDRPDAGLVDELVVAADAARATYRLQRAVDLRLRAHDVCGDAGLRDALILEALVDQVSSQDLEAVRLLVDRAQQCPPSALRDLAFGVLARDSGEVGKAKVLLERAYDRATEAGDPEVRERAAVALASLLVLLNDGRPAVLAAERALRSEDPERAVEAANLKALGLWAYGDLQAALDEIDGRPAHQLSSPVAAETLAARGMLRMYAGHLHEALEDLDASVALAPVWRPSVAASRCYVVRSTLRYLLGRWDDAAVDAAVARALAERGATSWNIPLACALSALVPAWRGQWALAEGYLAQAKEGLAVLSTPYAADYVLRLEVTLASARGDDEAVLGLVESTDDSFWERQGRIRTPRGLMCAWMRAFLATGQTREAERLLGRYERLLERWPLGPVPSRLGWMRGRLAELAGDPQRARDCYLDDLADPATALVPFVRAQLLQSWGRLEHALGDRAEGAGRLLEAASVFEQLGAEPSLTDCRGTLTSWGVRSGVPGSDRLTAREQDVCALALAGRTNREMAAELFLTTKTVEFHLHNLYAKLGIASRKDLRRRSGGG